MPQLYNCIRYIDRPAASGAPIQVTVLQVKRNGQWVDVPTVKEESDANSG